MATSYTRIGGISSNRATSFMTLILVKPCCRCPRSSNGMTAAFLYWLGYRLSTSLMSSSFCALNLKGIEGLLSGVSRCYELLSKVNGRRRSSSYEHTTLRLSLRITAEHWKARLCWRGAIRATRVPVRSVHGASLEAILCGIAVLQGSFCRRALNLPNAASLIG